VPIVVREWDVAVDGPLSEASIRAKFVPSSHFRITRVRYPANTKSRGTMRSGLCFVLGGKCRFEFSLDSATLHRGEIGELPEGSYSLEALGRDDLEIVLCWELPSVFHKDN
jgi:hypothetical protein